MGGEKEIGKNTKKDKPQLRRGKEKREVNKRDESERKKKSLKSSSHSERCSAPGTRTTPSSILSDLPLRSTYFPSLFFFPPPLPPCLSVLLFVIWPSRSFKSASPFLSPPPTLLLLLLSQSHSLLLTNSPSRSQSANLIPLAPRSLTRARVDWFCRSTSDRVARL